jgi:ubiquitin thioesterase protein OTUB1
MTSEDPNQIPITDRKLSDLTDLEILALSQSIKDEEANKRPLVSKLEPIKELSKEYEEGSEMYLKKTKWLEKVGRWSKVRRLRGRGIYHSMI